MRSGAVLLPALDLLQAEVVVATDGGGRGQETVAPLTLAALYREHARTVARWAGRLGGPTLDVEDVVQEVFLLVERLLPRYRAGGGEVTTWLYRITENVVRDQRRKQRWRRWLGGSAVEVAGTLETGGLGPAEQVERREATELVYRALDGLPEKYRTVLVLYELEGLSGEEISQLTGTKLSTVWVWLHRARQKFEQRVARLLPEERVRLAEAGAAKSRHAAERTAG